VDGTQSAQSHEGAQVASGVQLHESPQPHVVLHAQLSTLEAQAQVWPQLQGLALHSLVIGASWVLVLTTET